MMSGNLNREPMKSGQTRSNASPPNRTVPRLLALAVLAALSGCLWSCGTSPGQAAAPTEEPSSARRPNVILIMADDLGYETLGANGGTSYRTPRLDALAESGMRFAHAHSTPLCTPSRVQLMTGKYNFRNYIGFGLLDPEERTFGHLFQEAGYRTAVVGKWQLYGNEVQRELAEGRGGSLPREAGFDEYALWQVAERGPRYKSPHVDVSGTARDYPDGYGPDVFVEYIEEFLERNREREFFLYYPMVLTHDPFRPTPDDPDYAELDPQGVNDPAYFGSYVAYMDRIVGRIVDTLDRLELRENTLLLFVGDNGSPRPVTSRMGNPVVGETYDGDRVVQGSKSLTIQTGTHVPMIASWPGVIGPGQVNDNLVDFTDFLPSLMEAVGAELPDEAVTDGVSFYPQLVGLPATPRSWIFCHYAPRWNRNFDTRRFVHDKRWKLYDDGTFYDIAADPLEQSPIGEEDLAAEVRDLRRRFQSVLDRMH